MLAEKAEFPVKLMARVLGVSRSGFCSWLSNGINANINCAILTNA